MANMTSRFLMASLGGLKRIAVGEFEVPTSGAEADIDTGLTTINSAFATIKGTGPTGTEITMSVTVDFDTDDGLVDLYAWDVAGAAATSDTVTVMIIAIGE